MRLTVRVDWHLVSVSDEPNMPGLEAMELDAYGPPSADMFSQYLALGRVLLATGVAVYGGAQFALDPREAVAGAGRVLKGGFDGVCGAFRAVRNTVRQINQNANEFVKDAYV